MDLLKRQVGNTPFRGMDAADGAVFVIGLSGLMSGFSADENDEEFRPFIRRLPGVCSFRNPTEVSLTYIAPQNSSSGCQLPKLPSSPCSQPPLVSLMSLYTGRFC
jgi:hypothetical protein